MVAIEIKGHFSSIKWRAEDPEANPFVIATFRSLDGRTHTVKGIVHGVDLGLTYTLVGTFKVDKWGEALSIESYSIEQPRTEEAVVRFLDNVPGIGATTARKLVHLFGTEAIDKLRADPIGVAKQVDRFRPEVAVEAARYCEDKAVEIDNDIAVRGLLVDFPNATVRKAIEKWKGAARAKITENPYVLMELPGIGFLRADQVARGLGVPMNDPRRLEAGVMHVGNSLREEGNTLFGFSEVVQRSSSILTLDPAVVRDAIEKMGDAWQVWPGTDTAQLMRDRNTELKLAKWISDRVNLTAPLTMDPYEGPEAPPELVDDQVEAFKAFFSNQQLFILTGPPGTGKTYTVKRILEACSGLKIACCAPTGKAAQRITELTGYEAKTIHRLLGAVPSEKGRGGFSFTFDEMNKLEADLIVVDEFSMVDTSLAWHLFQAIRPSCKVLLVGDHYQLPSVGPGSVLRDLMLAKVPNVKLTKIKRQNPGGIVLSCHAMVQRKPIEAEIINKTDLWIMPAPQADSEDKVDAAARTIVDLYLARMPSWATKNLGVVDPQAMLRTVQILTPRREGHALGAKELNKRIHDELLRAQRLIPTSYVFSIGERVIQVKNDAEIGAFNGDLGIVIESGKQAGTPYYLVKFDTKDQPVKIPAAGNNLQMAYAMTVHKSQGSEWPVVIIPTLGSFGPFFDRPLIYTGISRASKMCVCVGSLQEFNSIATKPGSLLRRTGLREAITLELQPVSAFKAS